MKPGPSALPWPVRFNELFTPVPHSGCWLWDGSLTGRGYGQFSVEHSRNIGAHRAAWLIYRGDPAGRDVLHKCDVKMCVNPEHLFLGTNRDNQLDYLAKHPEARRLRLKAHCPHGHAYTPENTGFNVRENGRRPARYCRMCRRIRAEYRDFRVHEKKVT